MKVKVTKAPRYIYLFDKKAAAWTKDPTRNKFYLLRQQDYMNENLKALGRVFLNEVFEALGMPRTKLGQVVGWIYDEKNPIGDNFVNFGLYDSQRKGINGAIVLNFNVDGCILDRF